MKDKPDYIIDFRESITPLSLLRVGQLVKQMKPHELLEIIVRDPDVRSDVLKIVFPWSLWETNTRLAA